MRRVRATVGVTGSGADGEDPITALPWRRAAAPSVEHEVAARREMAKKRVVQDGHVTIVSEFSIFATTRGDELFTQSWRLVIVEIK